MELEETVQQNQQNILKIHTKLFIELSNRDYPNTVQYQQ